MPQIKLVPIKTRKGLLDPKKYKQALKDAREEAEMGVLEDYRKTTRTWAHQPPFYSVIARESIIIFTPDKIYEYVSEGTRAHLIFPKRARALRYRANFRAKTRPQVISSSQGSKSGKVIFSKGVIHPGTKARLFHETIGKKWIKKYPSLVNAQLRKATATDTV